MKIQGFKEYYDITIEHGKSRIWSLQFGLFFKIFHKIGRGHPEEVLNIKQ